MRPYTRVTRIGHEPYPALPGGLIDSNLPGYHVYVFDKPDKKTKAFYTLCGPEHAYLDADRIAFSVPMLDHIFEQRLEYHLRIFRALHALKELSGSRKQLEQSMLAYLREVQQRISESKRRCSLATYAV